MTKSSRILIVTDGRKFPLAELEERGFAVTISKDCNAAFQDLLAAPFDLAVIDFSPAGNGVEFIERVRATPQLAAILILIMAEWGTGQPTLALAAGADAYEPVKGEAIDLNRLITSIERLLTRQAAAAN